MEYILEFIYQRLETAFWVALILSAWFGFMLWRMADRLRQIAQFLERRDWHGNPHGLPHEPDYRDPPGGRRGRIIPLEGDPYEFDPTDLPVAPLPTEDGRAA